MDGLVDGEAGSTTVILIRHPISSESFVFVCLLYEWQELFSCKYSIPSISTALQIIPYLKIEGDKAT